MWGYRGAFCIIGFLCLMQPAMAVRYQFFLGLGQSIGAANLHTSATNQMTKNTSSVNEKGGYYYSQTQLGDYNGSVRDITSVYVGSEVTFDKMGIFTVRGYMSASYSNKVDFGTLQNLRDGNVRKCNAGEMPDLTNICFRDEFYTSVPNAAPIKFNANPGFANQISNNAFMMNYAVGVDFGANVPLHVLVSTFSSYKKMIPVRVGVYGGFGYEFSTYSLGHLDKRTYDNTTSGGTTYDPSTGGSVNAQGITLNANDKLYLSGAGAFARVGFSAYVSNNLRLDIGVKIPLQIAGDPAANSQKWYQVDSQNLPTDPNTGKPTIDKVFAQQLLRQEYTSTMNMYWQFAVNVLF